jgi:hypothetical protein
MHNALHRPPTHFVGVGTRDKRAYYEAVPHEYLAKVTIQAHCWLSRSLKIALGQLCFDQQVTQPHIHFGAIDLSIYKGDTS